jgi:hypothetical protein
MSAIDGDQEKLRSNLQSAVRFFESLRDDARYFLESARHYRANDEEKCRTYLRACVITSFAALEAYINTLAYVVAEYGDDLDLHERAFLQERKLELDETGNFVLRGQRYHRLEDKLRFLHWRSKGVRIDSKNTTWMAFQAAKDFRDSIVHAKPDRLPSEELSVASAESVLTAVTDLVSGFLGPYHGAPLTHPPRAAPTLKLSGASCAKSKKSFRL